MKQELIYGDLCYEIYGIFYEVHNELGRYCNEKQYGDLFEKKIKERKIKYEREKIIPQSFEGEQHNRNRVDFILEDKIIIEFKCRRVIERDAYYQLQRYLIAFNKKFGLIVNFRERYLKPKRIINNKYSQ